jgi:hypothetical protein
MTIKSKLNVDYARETENIYVGLNVTHQSVS